MMHSISLSATFMRSNLIVDARAKRAARVESESSIRLHSISTYMLAKRFSSKYLVLIRRRCAAGLLNDDAG